MCVGTEWLAAEVATAKLNGYDENYGNWPTVKENLVSFYNSTYDFIETLGLKDPVLTVAVVNDENPENVLLMIMYGIVVYDVMAE